MRRLFIALTLILPAGPLHPQTRAADEAAIRAHHAAIENAVNQRDAAAFAALFTPDGDAIFGDSPLLAGREAIRRFQETNLAAWPPTMRFTLTVTRIRFLAQDIALVDDEAHFSKGAIRTNRGTAVMVRQDGNWLQASLRVFAAQRP